MESMRPIAITLTTGMRGWSSVCLPMLIVIMTCVSGMAPGAFQSRGLRCNMVDLIGYCTLCMQACLCIPLRGLPAGSSQQYIPLMSTIAMHCSVHAVHTSMSVHRESCKGMRQCTRASADIFPPVGWFCIAVLHVVCVGMPVSWGQTPQDALLTHALSAFAPEGIGSVWCIWSSLLFRLLDTGGEVDE